MILGFKTMFPWGEPTNFSEKIISGKKLTTIREGSRWKPGMKIHFATGVRTKNYNQFASGVCRLVYDITIVPKDKEIYIIDTGTSEIFHIKKNDIKAISRRDGFDSVEDFWKYFDKLFQGQLISWKLD
jgi:hypothetical protein